MPARFNPAVVAGFLLLLAQSQSADAAGLGKAKVLSSAGELLKVRVELILGPGDRPSRIKAAVASPSIPEDDEENQLWVTVDPAPYGRAVLTVRSIAPVRDTRLELLVAVSSPAGRAYRNFDLELPQPRQQGQAATAGGAPVPAAPGVGPPGGAGDKIPGEKPTLAGEPGGGPAPGPANPPGAEEALADLEDQAAFGRLMALIALGIALLAALGAVGVWFYRRG